ncbi:uncharacterized protein E0L32_000494 [Thyridium curvatum]|uniref:Uncharacterized protein n=1 Tax=Thyridium curvatum TaxID=1093900 RepID=A0A507BBW0_9PEZI|nr:uncharacterized protein E0L32_000494 [Thyridium curvatum]TPX14100.1 hypothetical protein E0L32_000494 [Thyridium curvatum]
MRVSRIAFSLFAATASALPATARQDTATTSPPPFAVHLVSGPLTPAAPTTFELASAHTALNKLKDRLGARAIRALLRPDIDAADRAWHAILARASSSSGGGNNNNNETGAPAAPILSEARVRAYNTAYDAGAFVAWFAADTGDPHKMSGAHPEHYVESMAGQAVDIVEAWGPLVTRYRIPAYVGGGPKRAFMRALPGFPHQATGQAVLQDGSLAVVGDIHNSFRDLRPGEEVEAGTRGVEAVLAVWLPAGTPADVVEGLREHQAVEFSNWFAFAQRDVIEGRFAA